VLFILAARELTTNCYQPELLAQAQREAGGVKEKAEARYIALRVAQLLNELHHDDEREEAAIPPTVPETPVGPAAGAPGARTAVWVLLTVVLVIAGIAYLLG
jgi:hypothetical protein